MLQRPRQSTSLVASLFTTLAVAFRPASRSPRAPRLASTLASTSSASAMTVVDRPYGAWESPITSKAITAGSVQLGGPSVCGKDVYWLEGRPQEGGRYVLCRYAPDDPGKSER